MTRDPGDARWDDYLRRFHRDAAGITERVLRRSTDDTGITPYAWLLESLPLDGLVIDVACGSAPLWSDALAGRYVGVDVSPQELALAEARGAHPLVLGSATALPAATGAARTVLCSMALMILPDLELVLGEVRRVLEPGGLLAAILPSGPTAVRDGPMLAGLVGALGSRPSYRNDAALKHPADLLDAHGLRLDSDERRRFVFPLRDRAASETIAASLYLPEDDETGRTRAASYLEAARHLTAAMPVPIRRLLAHAI